ncbi:DUF3179 domain-containing (seleno)protein [Mucilaginibacter flavus]|uniref:DUF3179 domain-containing (seleno)protein n=1 Tax=Mucilaginibacter flavus TaxID=931504 RepID=UPI0025B37F8B|nr:DUF3179 domain-containing (seleno)protein [Mucilaginibacter flavus]MDN3580963.1 DUF3179 domain-containing (seleno)protein [Mucilaginibacter flavus]
MEKYIHRPGIFWIGIILLVVPGLVHAYLLMPFPGSQDLNAITVCYYLEKIVNPLRLIGLIFIVWYLYKFYNKNTKRGRWVKAIVFILCLCSFYITDYMYKAETMFKETQAAKFANGLNNKVPLNYLVVGVVNNGVAKAYPVIYLGYHHKVQDNVGGQPVLVTYCTMCRTGRVYNPVVNGKRQNFRLVGARHYNAIIEDESTRTWWYQATGNAAVGKLKGQHLQELPYEQLTLGAWLQKHPTSMIMQPDKLYAPDYADLKNYDRVQAIDKDSTLKNKDSLIRKSWVIGVIINGQAKAYDWRHIHNKRLLNDEFNHNSLLIGIEKDSLSYHVWNTTVNGKTFHFDLNKDEQLTDKETASVWDWDGLCIAGTQKGQRLTKVQAYQEYWHSWKHFHPATTFWKGGQIEPTVAMIY